MSEKGLTISELNVEGPSGPILKSINLRIAPGEILSVIGPAGSGKTTLLRCVDRLTELDSDLRVSGNIFLHGQSIRENNSHPADWRKKIGLVFSVPTPLPWSIYENLAFGLKVCGLTTHSAVMGRIQASLQSAYLWDEVKDRLSEPALNLSGGQQQRLCLARSLTLEPDVLALDEPCSGLDPISTAKIEEALQKIKQRMAIILVTNNVKQASRASDRTAFLLMGELVEIADTQQLFSNPRDKRTEDYITGRFG